MSLTSTQEETLSTFMAMTNAESSVAKAFLKATSWEINTAMDRFFAFGGDVSKLAPPKTNRVAAPPQMQPIVNNPNMVPQPGIMSTTASIMQQALGGLFGTGQVPQASTNTNINNHNVPIPQNAPMAAAPSAFSQTDQDALLAQQLAAQNQPAQPYVRAPDQVYQERLVGPYTNQYGSSIYRQKQQAQQNFAQDWKRGKKNDKSSFLGALFSDPDYKFMGSLEEAKKKGSRENKWVLVNIQDTENFCSHCLNRDIWKDKELGPVIKESFIFYQWMKRTDNARRVINLYQPTQFPCIFVIDPNTGRHEYDITVPDTPDKVATLKPKLLEFLDDYPNPKAKPKKAMSAIHAKDPHIAPPQTHEEKMLQQAIAASLTENPDVGNGNADNTNAKEEYKDWNDGNQDVEMEEDEVMEEPQEENLEEQLEPQPETNDPNATAIRIRMPNGAILQRHFRKDAKVAQLYIWCTLSLNGQKVSLLQTMPRLKLDDMRDKTLKELGLIRATLVCSYLD
eukprot:11131_1